MTAREVKLLEPTLWQFRPYRALPSFESACPVTAKRLRAPDSLGTMAISIRWCEVAAAQVLPDVGLLRLIGRHSYVSSRWQHVVKAFPAFSFLILKMAPQDQRRCNGYNSGIACNLCAGLFNTVH